jgi:hypothetical protein
MDASHLEMKPHCPEYRQRPSTEQFVLCGGLMKRAAMVHKRAPAADDSPAAAAL